MDADLSRRIADLDWTGIERSLWDLGYARTPPLLTAKECAGLVGLYTDDARFRKTIDMERHRFGVGQYRYFAAPLPPIVQTLREAIYPPLARVANGWMKALGARVRFPADLTGMLRRCRRRGQTRPTPLLLRYEAGGYNCLHQDLYGEVVFPLQMTCVLSRPGIDYTGGEFLLVEQRPRAQSRGEAVPLDQGGLILFPTRERPVAGARGHLRAAMRHGVSRLTSGTRYSLGVILHDAR